jgi:DNA-binding NtrC family response regulator
VPADLEDEIHSAVLASLERQLEGRPPAVLVVHELELTRRALERDARALGYEPVTAASVDEALAWLEEPGHDLSAIVIDGHMDAALRLALLDRVIEQRPAARRLLLSGLARTSLSSIALTSGHAHAVVTQPWNLQSFGEALRGAMATAADPAS